MTLKLRDNGPTTREKLDRSASRECSNTYGGPSPDTWASIVMRSGNFLPRFHY